MWLPFFRLSLGEPNSMLTQKKSVGGTHLRGGTRGWLWAQCKHSLLCHPASFLPLAPSFPLSGCQEGGGGEALCPFPCPFHPSFSWTLRRFPFRPLQPVAQHGEPPPSPAASPTAQVGPSPSLTLAFGFPPSSLNDASATCGPIIRAPEEGIRGRNRRRAEMIKWKGGRWRGWEGDSGGDNASTSSHRKVNKQTNKNNIWNFLYSLMYLIILLWDDELSTVFAFARSFFHEQMATK